MQVYLMVIKPQNITFLALTPVFFVQSLPNFMPSTTQQCRTHTLGTSPGFHIILTITLRHTT